ncbi:MAG: DNA translocase FtsK 4TM domain-containing protein, partial [Nitriliruptorales bacterium]
MRSVRRHLGDQAADIYGIALFVLAVITGLGLYGGRGGAVGATLAALSHGLFGKLGYGVPPLLAYAGIGLVWNGSPEERGRRVVGLTLVLASALAGWHLISGAPHPNLGVRALWEAGGVVGWALSRPLQLALGRAGAGALLVGVGLLGLLIATKTSLRQVGRGLAAVG